MGWIAQSGVNRRVKRLEEENEDHGALRHSPNAQIVIALAARVSVAVRIQFVILVFVRVEFLNLGWSETVNDSRVELVHLLPLDDFVTQFADGLTRRQAATAR